MAPSEQSDDAAADVISDVGARVTRGFALSVVRLLLGQLLGVVAIVVLTNQLSESEYALYGAIAAAGPAAFVLLTGSLGIALVRHAEVHDGQVRAATTIGAIALGVGAVVAVTVGSAFGHTLLGGSIAAYLLLLAPCLPAWVVLHRQLRSAAVAFMDLADRAGFQVGMMLLVSWTALSATQAVSGALVLSGLAASVAALLLLRGVPRPGAPRHVGVTAVDTLSALLLTFSSVGLEATLIPVVAATSSASQAGYFAWSLSIMVVPLGFASLAYQVLLPGFSRAESAALTEAVGQATRLVFAIGVVMTTMLLTTVPSLVTWLFPARWEGAMPALAVLGAATIVYAATLPLLAASTARGRLPQVARMQLTATIVGLAAAGILAFAYGAVGGAIGLLMGRSVLLAFTYADARREGRTIPHLARLAFGAALAPFAGVAAARLVEAIAGGGPDATVVALALGSVVGLVVVTLVLGRELLADARTAWTLLRSPRQG